MSKTIYYVENKGDPVPKQQLVRADSPAKARDHVLKVVTVRKATQEDMMLAMSPNGLKIEEAD